ncbi:asparaginase domain-containing protein [Roseovarius sp. S4756]|uniref:asparaginase domain-containing protein n=1 Tax=Roseovarius maritimus TaxID=3342637 RepID=UPI003728609A
MSAILVLHTGGTIGMAPGPDGFAPSEGVVETALGHIAPSDATVIVRSFSPLIDSAEIGADDWNHIIDEIAGFEGTGVILTHGTDTMAFTGAALAQALAGIEMPVILCGAMHALDTGGDAEDNLALALEAAQTFAPGVWLAFGGQVLPAAGLVKVHSQETIAFKAVPQSPVATPAGPRRFGPCRLAILTLSPGLPAMAVGAMLRRLDGAVLRVYGAGTTMSDPALMQSLSEATARGCRIRAVSQCLEGGLTPGAYAAGAALWRAGIENGGTQTPEAAFAQLWLELSSERERIGPVPEAF